MQPWVSLWTPIMYVSILIICCAFSRKLFFCLLCSAIVFSAVPIIEWFLSADPTYISVSRKGMSVNCLLSEHYPDLDQLLTASEGKHLQKTAGSQRWIPEPAQCLMLHLEVEVRRKTHRSFRKLLWKSEGNRSSPQVILLFNGDSKSLGHLLFQMHWHRYLGMRQVRWCLCGISKCSISKDYF